MSTGEVNDSGMQSQQRTKITDPMIGKVLDGRYEILHLLGTGGMGAVYKAKNIGVDKFVAVKIMHPQLMLDERTTLRFRHEVKAMSKLSHPNLISIIDAGSTEFGSPYFVMEYLPSKSLAEIIQQEVFLGPERAKPILTQIADALLHAHEKNIIHRDLKPPNILVIESGTRDHVKVVDLGVAKLLIGEDEGGAMKLTRTGEVFGSPLYMAPEQVLGRPHDNRTDIYQLGCVMFEMLTGVPPFVSTSAILTMNSHVEQPTPHFNDVMPDLPMDDALLDLERIVFKCLEKDPAARFQSMAEFMHAIEHGLEPKKVPVAVKSVEAKQQIQAAAVENRIAQAQQSDDSDDKKRKIMLFAILGVVVFVSIVAIIMFFSSFANSSHKAETSLPQQQATSKMFTVEYPAVASDHADLRVLSVYEGKLSPEQSTRESGRKGNIDVSVSKEGKPLILVLNSYMPTTWTIKKANHKVKIKSVISVGYFPQQVKGLAPGTVHTKVYYLHFKPDGEKSDKPTHTNLFDMFHFLYLGDENMEDATGFLDMKRELEKATNCHIRNFQGTRSTGHFEVR